MPKFGFSNTTGIKYALQLQSKFSRFRDKIILNDTNRRKCKLKRARYCFKTANALTYTAISRRWVKFVNKARSVFEEFDYHLYCVISTWLTRLYNNIKYPSEFTTSYVWNFTHPSTTICMYPVQGRTLLFAIASTREYKLVHFAIAYTPMNREEQAMNLRHCLWSPSSKAEPWKKPAAFNIS